MTKKYNFSNVRVLLADSLPASRKVIKRALKDLGFVNFTIVEDMDVLRENIEKESFDLLIADTELPGSNICDLVYEIRHGSVGRDPFMPVLLTTWQPTEEAVQRVVSAGADVLLTLPISNEGLATGLEMLIDRRKPFVVTSDYIGPDRRKKERTQGMQVPLIEVPNPVRAKATGRPEAKDFRACLDMINEQKVERHAYQIGYLIKAICDSYASDGTRDDNQDHLDRLRAVAQDMGKRIAYTRYAHQAKLCQSLIALVDGFDDSTKKTLDRSLQLLTQTALALDVAVHSDDRAVDTALDIANIVQNSRMVTTHH